MKVGAGCVGCGQCAEACPVGAVFYPSTGTGVGYKSPEIDQEKCLNCGVCAAACAGDCIK